MFTGLIHHVGIIQKITSMAAGIKITLQTQFTDLNEGESIAIDGVCLTVSSINDTTFTVEISPETLATTLAKNYRPNDSVNLERALKLSDTLGGHFVTGHVDQTVQIVDMIHQHDFTQMIVTGFSHEQQNYLIHKGSIAINGVSLTINKIDNECCHLMLIPHTLQRTNLISLTKKSLVNIEFDMLAKLVSKQLAGTQYAKNI